MSDDYIEALIDCLSKLKSRGIIKSFKVDNDGSFSVISSCLSYSVDCNNKIDNKHDSFIAINK